MAQKTRTSKTDAAPDEWAGSFEQWTDRAGPHKVTLKSGQRIEFRLMGVAELTLRGSLPEQLREIVALDVLNRSEGGIAAVIHDEILDAGNSDEAQEQLDKHLSDLYELNKHLAAAGLIEPKRKNGDPLTPDDLEKIPFADLEQIVELVTGQRAFDSLGVRVGVEPLDTFARFHHHHGIDTAVEDCESCDALRREFSSLHVGAV